LVKRIAVGGLVAIALAYAAVCVIARSSYRRYVYPHPPPIARRAGAGERLALRAADGQLAHALWFPPPPAARVIVYFHGNGEQAEDNVPLASELVARGFGVLLVEYRGYGVAAGQTPSEEALYLDGTTMLDDLARRGVPASRIALWGMSLGTGVAAEMARRGRGASLVLVAPFVSLTAVASRFLPWWLPACWVVPDRYDTLSKARDIRVPTLVVHGDRDDVVPYAMGRTVAGAIDGARMVTAPGAGHNDVYARGGATLIDLIARHCRGADPSGH
jgi:alpha-beta hydrolase superfamily lysophospholipase